MVGSISAKKSPLHSLLDKRSMHRLHLEIIQALASDGFNVWVSLL
jgi:hypothetical protein